ncbi:C45 family autoproteolytic acyltransferase/hydolase [Collinsella ureilytica]|nr:C45 family peptidase [Collinsella urealyticum]
MRATLNTKANKQSSFARICKRVILVALALLVIGLIGIAAVLRHEIKTVVSITEVDSHPLYTMTYDGDYGFDDFLQKGASSDTELINFVVTRLMRGVPIKLDLPDLACATFNATSPTGDALFGRNFDLTFSPAMLVRTKPEHGYESISMVNLAFLGYGKNKLPDNPLKAVTALAAPYAPLDGMNEKGLAVGVLLIDTDPTHQQTDKPDITTTTAIRMMLDKCATVDEAVEMLGKYDMHASAKRSYHFQIADASGKSVVVEYLGNDMNVIDQGNKSYLAATNFLLSPGNFDFGGGYDRYDILMSRLNATDGVMTEHEAMDALQASAQNERLNKKGEPHMTQWSVVYNLDQLTATVVCGMQYDTAHTFSLKK